MLSAAQISLFGCGGERLQPACSSSRFRGWEGRSDRGGAQTRETHIRVGSFTSLPRERSEQLSRSATKCLCFHDPDWYCVWTGVYWSVKGWGVGILLPLCIHYYSAVGGVLLRLSFPSSFP